MKSPNDQWIIQIEITNACVHNCSNCSRFCGHHKKPFFMDYLTFKRSVDSLVDHVGLIGIMGGEPTLHPEFERFLEYLNKKIPVQYKKKLGEFVYPQKDFMESRRLAEERLLHPYNYATGPRRIICGTGIWSSMNPTYMKHFEIIQDTFVYQCLNDHKNTVRQFHQPPMVTRKEFGINDSDFKILKDKCWVNQEWSSSITPKGAFFCEIAAALDMLLDGPGGWPIEPGWWKRTEDSFGEQTEWCELCGLALETFSRDARDKIDDISPVWKDILEKINSPKYDKGLINLLEIDECRISEKSMPEYVREHGLKKNFYVEDWESRFDKSKSSLYPSGFDILLLVEKTTDNNKILDKIYALLPVFDKIFVYFATSLDDLPQVAIENRVKLYPNNNCFGNVLNKVLLEESNGNYLLIQTEEVVFNLTKIEELKKLIINPGTLHYIDFRNKKYAENEYFINYSTLNCGFAMLLNKQAISLRNYGFDRISRMTSPNDIESSWDKDKIVDFHPLMEYNFLDTLENQPIEGQFINRKPRKAILRKICKSILPYGIVRLIQNYLRVVNTNANNNA